MSISLPVSIVRPKRQETTQNRGLWTGDGQAADRERYFGVGDVGWVAAGALPEIPARNQPRPGHQAEARVVGPEWKHGHSRRASNAPNLYIDNCTRLLYAIDAVWMNFAVTFRRRQHEISKVDRTVFSDVGVASENGK